MTDGVSRISPSFTHSSSHSLFDPFLAPSPWDWKFVSAWAWPSVLFPSRPFVHSFCNPALAFRLRVYTNTDLPFARSWPPPARADSILDDLHKFFFLRPLLQADLPFPPFLESGALHYFFMKPPRAPGVPSHFPLGSNIFLHFTRTSDPFFSLSRCSPSSIAHYVNERRHASRLWPTGRIGTFPPSLFFTTGSVHTPSVCPFLTPKPQESGAFLPT